MRLLFLFVGLIFFNPLWSRAKPVMLADASASAEVQRISSQRGFSVVVTFNPVITLDRVTNKELTEVLAQFYAEEALSTFLQKQKGIDFIKARSSNKLLDEDYVQWTFLVPFDSIMDARVEVIELRKEVVGKHSSVIKAGSLMDEFRSSCFRDLRIAESVFSEEAAACNNDDMRKKLRQRIKNALTTLREKIREDDALFRAEKKELLEKVDKVEMFLFQQISTGSSDLEVSINSLSFQISTPVFIPPFDKMLMSEPILLHQDGVRSFKLKNGSIAVIAVGSADAANTDCEDIADLMASAALGKWKAGEEVFSESRMERNYQRSNSSNGTSEHFEIKRTSLITSSSMDFHKLGEKVGTWYSKDKKRFFVAFARIIDTRKYSNE